MKLTLFTIDELSLLQKVLEKRLEQLNKYSNEYDQKDKRGWKAFERFYISPIVSALDKISSEEISNYSSSEKLAFMSCINENIKTYYDELELTTPMSWLNISNEQRRMVKKLDICKDILAKCVSNRAKVCFNNFDNEFRFGNILQTFDKLNKSNKIFISKVGEKGFYKIAFVFNSKEFLSIELNHSILFSTLNFESLNGQTPKDYAEKHFSLIATKEKAREMFSSIESTYYPDGVIEFIKKLLS
jgi:hypothetical protein